LSGLLIASFMPPEKIQNIRDLHRYRKKMVQAVAAETNRVIRVLEDSSIRLSSVVSDVTGVCAGKLIKGLIDGRTDIEALVMECYHGRMKSSPEQIREAITGRLTPNNIFLLNTVQDHIDYLEKKTGCIDMETDKYLVDFEQELELLQIIPGIAKESVARIICETGVDIECLYG
jgi:hypothetical protein